MLYSMTGFGRAVAETSDKKITVEIKSLNSKQMDASVRLPHQYRDKENEIRNIVARELQRGKTDVIVTTEAIGDSTPMEVNIAMMKAYKNLFTTMAAELAIPEPADWYSLLLRFPETMRAESNDLPDNDEMEALMSATQEAVNSLMQHRRSEGVRLEEFFAQRIAKISALLKKVPLYEQERIEHIRSRITDNLSAINTCEYDKGRFEQEMIYYIEKLDINEEKQRLAQHLKYFMETMAEERGQGKKLGFISQEMGREINTLGSKSNHAELQRIVVMMKDELEQIKEQVLNVM